MAINPETIGDEALTAAKAWYEANYSSRDPFAPSLITIQRAFLAGVSWYQERRLAENKERIAELQDATRP